MKTRIALAATFVLSGLTAGQSPVLAMTPYTCAVGSMAEARDDVDVYNSPVEPRAAYENYFIKEGTKGKVLARHEDGWCKLDGVAPSGGDGWVAEDHLKSAEATDAVAAAAAAAEPRWAVVAAAVEPRRAVATLRRASRKLRLQ